ncbi:Bromo_TP domain-containing protein/TAF8_C domain-containing protein, partial [Cephalotus follicularis]
TMIPKPKKPKTHQEEEIEPPESKTEISFNLTKIAVSQICKSVGFKSTHVSAIETLTLVATKYLETLAKTAATFSNASNRTQSNLYDVTNALHHLSFAQGFPGASTLDKANNYLLGSSVLKGLSSFVKFTDEIPFAKPIPRNRKDLTASRDLVPHKELGSRGSHIPKWLPEFPDMSTYKPGRRDSERMLWEEADLVVERDGDVEENKECDGSGDLPMERGRVRFSIGGVIGKGGVKVRNGLCRGGKRVCWNGTSSYVERDGGGVGEHRERRSARLRIQDKCLCFDDDDDDDYEDNR